MEEKGNTSIEIHDSYGDNSFCDSMGSRGRNPNKKGPSGFVEIYEVDEKGNKQLVGKHNLVLYRGREVVTSRMFNITNPNLSSGAECTEFISWLGVGSGGVSSGDPLDPIAPQNNNENLIMEIPLNATDATCGDFRGGFYYKRPLDMIDFEMDHDNEDAWLITRVMSTVTIFDANGYNISEAGLFTASSAAGGYSGHFTIFARVTFPAIVKSAARQLVFVWYLYF